MNIIKNRFYSAKLIGLCILLLSFSFSYIPEKVRGNTDFVEDLSIYKTPKQELLYFYVTIVPDQKITKAGSVRVFNDVLKNIDWRAGKKTSVKVIFQEGDKNGPQKDYYGFGELEPNASLRLRGHSTRNGDQKSFKIDLKKRAGLWNNQEILNLNKHPFDSLRIRNKLSFDTFSNISHIGSIRTSFVRLFIKDLTKSMREEFEDQGLYTLVEQMDKRYLKSHGLDVGGVFLKAEFFQFKRYPDSIMTKSNPDYSKKQFETKLEIRQAYSHHKLVKMLEDVNNPAVSMDSLFEKHFNKNNYITWLALNILLDNRDTNSQNFYLYRPADSDIWYFIPWDCDGAWGFYDQPGKNMTYEYYKRWPVANYWEVPLHQKFFKEKKNRDAIIKRMKQLLAGPLSKEIKTRIQGLRNVTEPLVVGVPDIQFNGVIEEMGKGIFYKEYDRIAGVPDKQFKLFLKSIKIPMPFYLARRVEDKGDTFAFRWGKSETLDGQKVEYEFVLSKTPDLASPIVVEKTKHTWIKVKRPASGKYFWKVTARDPDGNFMESYSDYYDNDEHKAYFGVQECLL